MKNTAAQQLGRLGGKAKTESKIKAAQANGKKGGRPLTRITTKRPLHGGVGAGILFAVHGSVRDTLIRIAEQSVESHRVVTRLEVRDGSLLIAGHQRANGLYPVTLQVEIDQKIPNQIIIE